MRRGAATSGTVTAAVFKARYARDCTTSCLTHADIVLRRYLGENYGDAEARGVLGTVNASDLPRVSAQSFPLCMANMYSHVREDHHLHHEGRQQLGLFLKVSSDKGRGEGTYSLVGDRYSLTTATCTMRGNSNWDSSRLA